MLSFLFSSLWSLITNPLIVIVGWFAGASFKKLPVALVVGGCSAAAAQLLALPLVHIFRAMEGSMAEGRWPGNVEFIASGAVGGMIVTTAIWLYKNSETTKPATASDSPSPDSQNGTEKQ